MDPLILVENEVTAGGLYDHWQDVTGERYQFPNQYRGKVLSGRPFVYYRGVRRADGTRGSAEYFGCGVIGAVYPDPANNASVPKANWKWICDIEEYRPFAVPVPAKEGGSYLEDIPQNFWGVAVRALPENVYNAILSRANLVQLATAPTAEQLQLPPLDAVQPTVAQSLLIPQASKSSPSGAGSASGSRRSKFSAALGRRGEEVVLKHLHQTLTENESASLRWVSEAGEQPGWDIEYQSSGILIAVEVKASGGPAFPSLEITANEWTAAQKKGQAYRLYLVASVRSSTPRIQVLENPASMALSGSIAVEPLVWRLVQEAPLT